ncbi:hypothetical protein EVAR_17811_1 [Eumeta japonica]|uniref:Uncharacterized protein n=1 Tax=Eumeta variegata TaxID=151549 RepID=A0A4C1TTU3_EUMVA|nr:hypothetical protein EVAR_17811_1 [Eumeta japonica]
MAAWQPQFHFDEYREAFNAFNEQFATMPLELENLSSELAHEIEYSKQISNDIHEICNTLDKKENESIDNALDFYDDLSFFMTSRSHFLMEDMDQKVDLNIKDTIAEIRKYTEELSKNCNSSEENVHRYINIDNIKLSDLNLEEYAHHLEQLVKCVTTIKSQLIENPDRDIDEELKINFAKLVDDVQFFTMMIEAQTILAQSNKKTKNKQDEDRPKLQDYKEITEKILTKANEVTYILSKLKKC